MNMILRKVKKPNIIEGNIAPAIKEVKDNAPSDNGMSKKPRYMNKVGNK